MTSPIPIWRWGDPVKPLRELLARGGVLAIPTESSYGLGADPWNQAGVETIYRIKHRERGKPLPVVVASPAALVPLGIDLGNDPDLNIVKRLFALWPGPLTVICSPCTASERIGNVTPQRIVRASATRSRLL